ncbi:MAG: GAF domain-containing protein [Flavobacteriaceae bacterium]|nr:MAG: GAF domain-containing protein [Flavobacteriaceae bacterium]
MRIITDQYDNHELPFKIKISFSAIFDYLEESGRHDLIQQFDHIPELKEGFDDFELLKTYKKEIGQLLETLFPSPLQQNEIKSVSIPFNFTSFKFTKRFLQILEDAGECYELKFRDFEETKIYIMACTFILNTCYGYNLDFKRPFFLDIPNVKTGELKHYRTLFNGDFMSIKKLENAPKITKEDYLELLDNFENIDLWKEKFPINSYELKGFGIMNLFDVTQDEILTNLKDNLLEKNNHSFFNLQKNIADLFGDPSIKFGFSTYDKDFNHPQSKDRYSYNSYILEQGSLLDCTNFFCNGIINQLFIKHELVAISDLSTYGKETNCNGFYEHLNKQDIKSVILVPFQMNSNTFGIMELVSPKKYVLNSVSANKLKDVIPSFSIAIKNFTEAYQNNLDAIIQKFYTSIHPTVNWRFYDAASNYLKHIDNNDSIPLIEDIVFEDVVPLYGQVDIKGSSIARNVAIKQDLMYQLELAEDVMAAAYENQKLTIYNEHQFRIQQQLRNLKRSLKTGDENSITNFLKKDIYPYFEHLKTINTILKEKVEFYESKIDDKLQVVYDKRFKYEQSVTLINKKLAQFIDTKQLEAQKMFPHYFERFKTDGIEFNMYIGQSLVKSERYNEVHLNNLRLWQLQIMCEMENIVYSIQHKLEHPLQVASLILVQSNSMAIKFRMDEKQFDVDGAYNIRYEIIKKRIDKALIKDSKERLTKPGYIAIVYTTNKDAEEYSKYIDFLKNKNYLTGEIEDIELQDLQGISGLKALRIQVSYLKETEKISFKEILEVLKN